MKYTSFNPNPYEAHMQAFSLIGEGELILDIGCATGYFARELQEKQCRVIGIEKNPSAAKIARRFCEKVFVGDVLRINSFPIPKRIFDTVLMLDVLEHIKNGEITLRLVKSYLKKGGKLIISTPNIAHLSIRLKLLFGNFNYQETGIMDKSHIHFFTLSSLIQMIKDAGLKIEKIDYSADFGQIPSLGRFFKYTPKGLQYWLTKTFPILLAVQFIVVSQK